MLQPPSESPRSHLLPPSTELSIDSAPTCTNEKQTWKLNKLQFSAANPELVKMHCTFTGKDTPQKIRNKMSGKHEWSN